MPTKISVSLYLVYAASIHLLWFALFLLSSLNPAMLPVPEFSLPNTAPREMILSFSPTENRKTEYLKLSPLHHKKKKSLPQTCINFLQHNTVKNSSNMNYWAKKYAHSMAEVWHLWKWFEKSSGALLYTN